jgi:hypothetical protein
MVVDVPANTGLEACAPDGTTGCPVAARGPKATKAFYPDDPSNVHHAYVNDFVKFRNVHTGIEHHIFHLHNHQWLFNPNDDNANYLDAQGIGPGGGYTYEINNGGAGNRNKSSGDAIFHCHFYPHFAQGMWELFRIHDVLETGTPLAVTPPNGFHTAPWALQSGEPAVVERDAQNKPAARARALPDGEIVAGTPIPAILPLPGKPMPPLPGKVTVVAKTAVRQVPGQPAESIVVGSVAKVDRTDTSDAVKHTTPLLPRYPQGLNPTGLKNPGYPFWLAGVEHTVGQRMPTPPLDMDPAAGGFDGGLPRHALDGYVASGCDPANAATTAVPRAECATSAQSRIDLTKEMHRAKPVWFEETGTDVEKAAMAFHSKRTHRSSALMLTGDPTPGDFITNGSGRPVPGAPFHEPCIDDGGNVLRTGVVGSFFSATGLGTNGSSPFTADAPRVYKGANIQFDAVLNKLGYHFPQQRIIALWEDAVPTITKARAPEPLVMRMNTFDCVMYQHTNLVPAVYEFDDYQVKTSTDIIGQHIHLPKWDLTTTDGSANGWNYEDGTLSPDAVRERIHAINEFNGVQEGQPGALAPKAHPYFGPTGPGSVNWKGARTTLQRWFTDPVVNADGVHRGLGIVFTHDHFGPSTHQQVGLYATVLVEPAGSTWYHNETGVKMYTRADGGPTSWQAQIHAGAESHREFYLEYTDFQHAYRPGVYIGRNEDGSLGAPPTVASYRDAVNPPVKKQTANVFPDLLTFPATCPGGVARPCPEAISADDPGFLVVNYRNEPIAFRVYDPAKLGPDGKPGAQADGGAGDLAFALQSRTDRKIAALNVQPVPGSSPQGTKFPPSVNTGKLRPGDPYTPMIRAYYGDNVRIKVQAGGDEESHNATVYGAKWLQGGSGFGFAPNSGWRNSQHAGISEQFTFASPALPMMNGGLKADQLWTTNPSLDGWWNGVWGIYRSYGAAQTDLKPLPNTATLPLKIVNAASFSGVCPTTARVRPYDLTAVLANDVLSNDVGATIVPTDAEGSATNHVGAALNGAGGTLVYNPRETAVSPGKTGPLHDPTALLWVRTADLVARDPRSPACLTKNGKLDPTLAGCAVRLRPTVCNATTGKCTPGAPVEPIVLRAAAGECLKVTVRNRLPATLPDLAGTKHLPPIVMRDTSAAEVTTFNNNLIRPSSYVGLHPALVAYDVNKDDGTAVGENGIGNLAAGILVGPGGKQKTFQWYAGDLSLAPTAGGYNIVATPVEFGGANIAPADVMKQGQKGLVGALIIEPPGATWTEDDVTHDRQSNTLGQAPCDKANPQAWCRLTRASSTVNGSTRDFAAVVLKGQNHRYKDGSAVEQSGGEGIIAEDAEESGQTSLNYGSEPMWFRFGLPPTSPFTGGVGGAEPPDPGEVEGTPPVPLSSVANAWQAYSNGLAGGDPATPVFTARAGAEARIHLLNPTGSNRASTFTLHGHVWQRDPYVCPGSAYHGLTGMCRPTGYFPTVAGEVGSRGIGVNLIGFAIGAQDLVMPGAHYTLRLPSAGGSNAVKGDYLFQDRSGLGNLSGLWSIMRVE